MTVQKTIQSPPLPQSMQGFIITFMQAIKAGRLYSSGHVLFKQTVKRLQDRLREARENRDFLFVGIAKDSLLISDEFHQVNDVHARDFLDLFHPLGISYLIIQKETTTQELESFVEILSGAKAGQGQEVLTALHHENVKRINLGLLDYSVFSGLESAVARFIQGREDAAIWRQLIFLPAMAGAFHLDTARMKEVLRLCDDPENLKRTLAVLDKSLKSKGQSISAAQRGQIIGNFLQNFSKAVARVDAQKRRHFNENVALLLGTIGIDERIPILGAASPELVQGEDGGVIKDLVEHMPEQELVQLLIEALRQGGAKAIAFNNLFQMALARFKSAGPLLNLVRSGMNRAAQERRQEDLMQWQHVEQILLHHQESEDFNAQYRRAIEGLATSIKMQKSMIEEEEMVRLLATMAPDSLKLFKAKLIVDLLQDSQGGGSMTHALVQSMGELVRYFVIQGRPRLTGNLLRQVFLSIGQLSQKDSMIEEVNMWLSTEDVHSLLKTLFANCRTYESREMSAISSICRLFPEKASAFLIDLYTEFGGQQGPLGDWLTMTIVSLAPNLTRVFRSRMIDAPDGALPTLIDLADLVKDEQIAPALERLLDHKIYGIRSRVIKTLGRLKSAKSVKPLTRVAMRKSWFRTKKMKALQMEALRALAKIQTKEARAVLEQMASTSSGELQQLSLELLERP